jgi:hypothetical protein
VSRRMRAAGIRNPRVVVVRNLAKSEHRNFASFAPSVKDSRAVRSSVLISDSESVSELTRFGFLQAPGTSVSRGVRGKALVKASERQPKGTAKSTRRQ